MNARTQNNASRTYPIGSLLPEGQSGNHRPSGRTSTGEPSGHYAAFPTNRVQKDPWPEIERLASGAVQASGRFLHWSRRTTASWAARTSGLWAQPGRGSKAMAIVCALAGVLALVLFAYLLIYLIPILILAALVAAVLAAVRSANQ